MSSAFHASKFARTISTFSLRHRLLR
jgi:hypothetical protein